MMSLNNQVAIITGAGQGMGRAIAERLAQDGAAVVVAGRTESKVQETAKIIEDKGGKALAVKADMSKLKDIDYMYEMCEEHFGAPDILIPNVSICHHTPLAEVTEDDFDETYTTNAKGTLFCLKKATSRLKDNGRIVVISSSASILPQANMLVYSSTKAALDMMVEVAAQELAVRNIRVNSVRAGITETPTMRAVIPQAFLNVIANGTPLKRIAVPEDIASVVSFLCGDDSRFITGQHILVNGGSTVF